MKKIHISVDSSRVTGAQDHYWRYIGYDECNYTYIPEGKQLLRDFSGLEKDPYYVRTHFMFCTGNCHHTYKFGSTNIYHEDEQGNPIYDFTYYDMIIDAQIASGNKPFAELGFMPFDLIDTANIPKKDVGSYNRYKEQHWNCPPKDYDKWHDLITALCEHLKEKYGEEELSTWYFELWNEPDIMYFSGTTAEYCKLFDYTEHAFHAVLPSVRLSGPAVTGIFEGNPAQAYLRYFLNHTKNGINYYTNETGTRLDFITFHTKGGGIGFEINSPKTVPSVESLVYQVKKGLDVISEYGYLDKELVLSEADPDGWAAGGIYDNQNMCFRNTEYYASYVASAYEKIERLSKEYGTVVRPLAWAFMFPGERCFEGTRTFATQGIHKAVFNLFRLYGKLGNEKLSFASDGAETLKSFLEAPDMNYRSQKGYTGEGEETDIGGFAVKAGEKSQVVIYSHNNDRDLREENEVTVTVAGLSDGSHKLIEYRIDAEHSNPYAEFVRQGSPLFPEGEVYAKIKARDGLEIMREDEVNASNGAAVITLTLPQHAVVLLEIQ